MEQLLRTDEYVEAVRALDMVHEQLRRVTEDTYCWKWVLIALHNALQGFMVLALRRGTNYNVLKERHAKTYLEAVLKGDKNVLDVHLDWFLELYVKVQSDQVMEMCAGSRAFNPSGTQTCSVGKLNKLRNEFVHFVPRGYLLGVNGLPQLAEDCLGIIRFLAFECGNVLWHEESLEQRTRELVSELKEQIDSVGKACSG